MARSRYADVDILDDRQYKNWNIPIRAGGLATVDLTENVRTFEYVLKAGDRADHLASKFFNDSEYWWVICLINNINYPFSSGGWIPGLKLKIPYDVQDVLRKIQR